MAELIEDKFEQIQEMLGKIETKLEKRNAREKINNEKYSGVKNSHLHIMINTDERNRLKKKAEKEEISLAEWCRRKLKEDEQLDRIEMKIDKLIK